MLIKNINISLFHALTCMVIQCLPEFSPKAFSLAFSDSRRLRKVTQSYWVRYSSKVRSIFKSWTKDFVLAPSWCQRGSK